jgi:hypothetical protein
MKNKIEERKFEEKKMGRQKIVSDRFAVVELRFSSKVLCPPLKFLSFLSTFFRRKTSIGRGLR